MLDFQVQQFPFRLGLAEGTDPHQVPPGTLVTAENAVWKQSGRLGKRFGTTGLVATIIGGGSIAACKRLFCRGSELCLVDGANLHAYSPTSANWRTVGKVPSVGITYRTLVDSVSSIAACESAVSASGLRVDAWVTGAGAITGTAVFVQVTDVTSGGLILAPVVAMAPGLDCSGVRVLIIGTTAIILSLTMAANISAVTVDLTTLAVSAVTDLQTNSVAVGGAQGWDACVIGSLFVIAYTATGPLLELYSYDTSLVAQVAGGITSEASGAHVVSIAGATGESLYVLYSQGVANPSPVRIAIADAITLLETVAPVTIETPGTSTNTTQVGVCRYDATNCIVSYRLQDGLNTRVTTYKVSDAAVVSATSQRGTFGTSMLSRPFMFAGACYMALTERSFAIASAAADKSSVLVEVEVTARTSAYTPHRYVGVIDTLIGGDYFTGGQVGMPPPDVASVSATSALLAVPFQSTAEFVAPRQGARVVSLTAGGTTDAWCTASAGMECFVLSSLLSSYDGRTLFDYGFPRAPAFYSLAASNGAGSIVAGTYLYGGTLEYRSATGLLYRSPAQTAGGTLVVGAPNDTVTIVTEGYNLGNKQTTTTLFGTSTAIPTLHAWYRTTINGATYQRLTVEPTYNVTVIDQMAGSASFTDLRADADVGGSIPLSTRSALYTTGGILDDYAPPGGVTMFTHVDRLWVLAGDQKTWWYSKAFQDDLGVAPGFNPEFRIVFEEDQTAGASMDDKGVFFSATGVRYMHGVGPAPNGGSSDFQVPLPIQSDVGCTNARSVVSTPDGVMFLSARGIYLLDRGLSLSWIGRPVKDTLAAFPNVTSAVLVAKHNQVRFTCNNDAASAGVVLVYDYVEKQWATSKYYDASTYGCPIADACMWNGAWTFATPAGAVFTESTSSYLDAGGSYVPMTLETAWISAAGPMAFHSVRSFDLHGTSHTDHNLTISVGFDSDASYAQTVTWAGTSAVTAVGTEEASVTIGTRRKCNTIRFKVVDATPSAGTEGIGRGPSFDMMGIDVGVKRGFGNAPATKRG